MAGAGRITICEQRQDEGRPIVAAVISSSRISRGKPHEQAAVPAARDIGMAIVGNDHANAVAVIERLNPHARPTASSGVEVRLVLAMPRHGCG
jgi:hypothetical protein